ncbi:hypothetical protein ACF0H5_009830 [Mactra antiquata]
MYTNGICHGATVHHHQQPMKLMNTSHVVQMMSNTTQFPRDQFYDRQYSIGASSNTSISPKQTTHYQVPTMSSSPNNSSAQSFQAFTYQDCQYNEAAYSRNIVTSDNTQRVPANISVSKPSPLGQLKLPTIRVSDNVAANVMSEEQDVGYFSFSDMSSLQDLSDLSDMFDTSEESDELFYGTKANFADLIDEVLDSFDNNQSFTEETVSHNSSPEPELKLSSAQVIETSEPVIIPEQYNTAPVTPEIPFCDNQHMKWCPPGHMMMVNPQCGFEQGLNIRCQLCHKYFHTKASLRVHMRQHRGERPYQCSHCKKSFTQKSTLRTHIRTHTGERPYDCNYCARAFGDYSTYRKHVRVHTGEKPYQCDICKKSFTQSGNMIRHRTVHFRKNNQKQKC